MQSKDEKSMSHERRDKVRGTAAGARYALEGPDPLLKKWLKSWGQEIETTDGSC